MFTFQVSSIEDPRYVINFPTKIHWRNSSRMDHIEVGLDALVDEVKNLVSIPIALPIVGGGLGGLNRNDLCSIIDEKMSALENVSVIVSMWNDS